MYAIQVIDEFNKFTDADQAITAAREQIGFLGGRILHPSPSKPGYRIQLFFKAADVNASSWLPDNTRLVFVPQSLYIVLGIRI